MKKIIYVLLFLISYSGYSQTVGNNKIVTIPQIGIPDISIASTEVITFALNGAFTAGTDKDGSRVMHRSGTILAVIVSQTQLGNNGNSTYDIHKHSPTLPITTQRDNTPGVTIYTTQANRPTIAGDSPNSTDNAIVLALLPDVTTFIVGDFYTMDVDLKTPQSQGVVIQLFVQYDKL